LKLLLEQGLDVSETMLDTKTESSEAGLAELLTREAGRLAPDSAVSKTNVEKIAIMDAEYGVAARVLAVKLNRIADAACDDYHSEPIQFGPFCPTVLKYAVANHQGVPCQGYLSENLIAIARDCTRRSFTTTSSGKLLASANVDATATVFPLLNGTSEKGKLVKSTWTGRSLGDLHFKLLSNTLRGGSKMGSTGARANQCHSGSFSVSIWGPLHKEADLKEAVLSFFRSQRNLPVYPTLFPIYSGTSEEILVRLSPGNVTCSRVPAEARGLAQSARLRGRSPERLPN
jgi:hypothetical protein